MRKILVLMAVCFLLPVTANAAEGEIRVRTERACQISVTMVAKPEGTDYRLLDTYGGGLLAFDDTLSSDLAAWLTNKTQNAEGKETEQGIAVFSGLEEGLYLVTHTGGENPFLPFLVCIPWDGAMWQVEVTPFPEEMPQTGDEIAGSVMLLFSSASGLLVLKRKKC